ncbi:hypothetical protein GWM83_04070 [Candidatus Bathyarchaeota archaeon]|nr:hypothetical protein [Candidatus Bathyarchaeota archaeon]
MQVAAGNAQLGQMRVSIDEARAALRQLLDMQRKITEMKRLNPFSQGDQIATGAVVFLNLANTLSLRDMIKLRTFVDVVSLVEEIEEGADQEDADAIVFAIDGLEEMLNEEVIDDVARKIGGNFK